MNDEVDPDSLQATVGLCVSCSNVRVVVSDRGSIFYQCQLAATDARFAKYPRLPVRSCVGFERNEESEESED